MNTPERTIQLLEGPTTPDLTLQDALRQRVIDTAPESDRETFLQMLGLEPYEAPLYSRDAARRARR